MQCIEAPSAELMPNMLGGSAQNALRPQLSCSKPLHVV